MSDYFPQGSLNYVYAPGRQWGNYGSTVNIRAEYPLINVDFTTDGKVMGVEIMFDGDSDE